MYPTLSYSGDFILQSRLLHSLVPLTPGSLVTYISPSDPTKQVLKRVIALEGEEVVIDPLGERARDAVELPEGIVSPLWGAAEGRKKVRIPRGHAWLAGDNGSNSFDSRDYGPVPLGLVKGRVVARVSEDGVGEERWRRGGADGFICIRDRFGPSPSG